jgi:hypothetical protein
MPECTNDTIFTGQACFVPFAGTDDLKSILIYLNAVELAAIGGTNYLEGLGSGGTLMADATCLLNLDLQTCLPPIPYLVIAYNNAVAAGGSPVSSRTELAEVIACNKNFTPGQKDAQLLWLTCQLGHHATV